MRATFTAAAVVGVLVLAGCEATEPGTTKSADSGSPAAAPGGPASPSAAGTAAGAPSVGTLPVGPGPQEHYTVQAQPAPGSCHYRYEYGEPLPDLACTPGAVSPAVTQDNLARTICKSGYTATIRPSSYVTGKEKKANALSYGYTGSLSDAEYDHLLSGVARVACDV